MGLRQILSRYRVLIEDAVLTAPVPGYTPRFAGDEGELAQGVAELRSRGYTSAGRLVGPDELTRLRGLIDAAVGGERPDLQVEWNERVKYWRLTNPLRLDALLVRLAVHPPAIALVERYFGRQPYLSDVDMRRVPPVTMAEIEKQGYSSSNWHRDTRGRQLKLMIYLSDVEEVDSNFALLPGTHAGAHRRKKGYDESRLSDAEVREMAAEPMEWYGMAGEAMLFDTNVIHRLRRKGTARVRDSVTFYYTPGQALSRLDMDKSALMGLPDSARAIFGDPGMPFKRVPIS